jgi:hypothetical protein
MPISLSGSLNLSGSLTTTGTITATTLVVQTITSSISSITGSTNFGSIVGNTHTFTGSLLVTGSLNLVGTSPSMTISSSGAGAIGQFLNTAGNTIIGMDNLGGYFIPSQKGTAIYDGSGTKYLYVTSSGVGIGTTTPARTLDVTGTLRVVTPNRSFFITSNAYSISDGTLSSGIGMDGAGLYLGNVTSSTGWTISNPQLFISSSGNVGIGTSSPSVSLDVIGRGKFGSDNANGDVSIISNTTPFLIRGRNQYSGSGLVLTWDISPDAGIISSPSLQFYTNATLGSSLGTKVMTIDNVGRVTMTSTSTYVLTVSNTTNTSGQGTFVTSMGSNNNNGSSYHYIATTGGGDKCYILGNGNLQNINNSYGALSDIRLKKEITQATPKLEKLLKVNIVNFKFINDEAETKQIGVIAQELEEIFPSLVEESTDRETNESRKSVKYSVFVPILIKAIQELTARVQELENK